MERGPRRRGLLLVVIDNGGYANEHEHQLAIGRARQRGNRLADHATVVGSLGYEDVARGQGWLAYRTSGALDDTLATGVAQASAGRAGTGRRESLEVR